MSGEEGFVEEPLEDSEEALNEPVDDGNNSGSREEAEQDEPSGDNNAAGQASLTNDEQHSDEMDEEKARSEEFTQRYLALLHSGKLASKKKNERQAKSARKAPPAEPSPGRSVFEQEMARLNATTNAMGGVSPIARNTVGGSRSGSRGGSRTASASPTRRDAYPVSPRLYPPPGSPPAGGHGSAAASPFSGAGPYRNKLYTPGPGAYEATLDRFGGREGPKASFGTARQRPPNACVLESVLSPGPIYRPRHDFHSSMPSLPSIKIGKQLMGARLNLSASMPSNCPHWNPGPGTYEPQVVYKGGKVAPGEDGPKPSFSRTPKMITPNDNLSATVFVSHIHALKENVGANTPGPGAYDPDVRPTRTAPCSFSLAPKSASYFDSYLDPTRQTSPGPVYTTAGGPNYRGTPTWGHEPSATFGRSTKVWAPETNLSAAPFISHEHAKHSNQTIHSPGPIYSPTYPTKELLNVPTPHMTSGQKDRFYSRFESGRVL